MVVALLTTDNRDHRREYEKPDPFFGTAPEALLQGFVALSEIEVHVVSSTQKPMRSPSKLADNIWFHSLHVPKIGWLRTGYQGCIRAVRKKLKEIGPDIVHGQGTERDNSIGAVFSGFPNVLTIHGNIRRIAQISRARPFSFLWLSARLEALTIPRSQGVICQTSHTRAAVASLARRTWLLPNAVDQTFFDVHPAPSPEAQLTILCVATVCSLKNQNNFIRALDPLAGRYKFNLVFLGQAQRGRAYGDEFLQLLASRPWCSHEGFADRAKLKTYFQRASALVLPSLEDNCPMVVLETMAAGVPVLAAKVGGVPDLIEKGKTGLFCDPLDAASMRTGVEKLLENPGLRRQLAVEAKTHAKATFHPLVIARGHLEIYREVLNLCKDKSANGSRFSVPSASRRPDRSHLV
ncbi:MAG: glycosyltransferase family 4 protein [Limisphaerales bacterium]